ncbi:hypothetical protein M0R45_020878 [Rubus argutus]|uniref:RCHY1 zinc-ribbon domain-containing protein n=1 Tax=Rubus argutus TaxID=59490 RepID=A0AAW1X9M1_RUBAR
MIKRDNYCCPICSKSVIDMSRTWKRIDEEIEATVMPEDYRHKKQKSIPTLYYVLANSALLPVTNLRSNGYFQCLDPLYDCNDTTEVYFHIIGQKCNHCKSYNTRTIAAPVLPQ